MNFIKNIIFFLKRSQFVSGNPLKSMGKKEVAYLLFLVLLCLFYVLRYDLDVSSHKVQDSKMAMEQYGERLKINFDSSRSDTIGAKKEREQLLLAIEERIVVYLYQVPDYSYMNSLETYLKYRPELLKQLPSAVPLEKGDYVLSSKYGIRTHPISGTIKTHYGIDLAAPSGKTVYAAASGMVSRVVFSDKGYGNHIIIKHRFGFESLYGHLQKVLVVEGQKVKQHELIATVGSSGNATGYHLHYETVKNNLKIDPIPSLNLKRNIYAELIELNKSNDGEKQ